MVPHPLSMREALGSIPSVSIVYEREREREREREKGGNDKERNV